MKTCFSIMPFKDGFEDIDRIIAEAAGECGLEYVRGDRLVQPGNILPQVLRHIRDAAVVVADISEHNPNVFYELGIAHQLKGPERVVILTQDPAKSPYDVYEFRQLHYKHTEAGRAQLRQDLPDRLRKAAQSTEQETWNVIRGRLPRTRLIVRDLRRLLDAAGLQDLSGSTIRVVAGLSALAISDHEPSTDGIDAEYSKNLVAERNSLRDALLRGARLKAVLNPPRRFAQAMGSERLHVRYRRLIGLLEGRSDITDTPEAAEADLAAVRQCEFALSPVPMPNLLIIGDSVAYEGMKRGGTGGFEMTHCETNAHGLRELIAQFDQLFDDSRSDMLRLHPPDGRLVEQLRAFYQEVISTDTIG